MKKIIVLVISLFLFTGCVVTNENNEVVGYKGIISGATYKTESLERIYKVVSKGVVTFMTEQEIKDANLDKVDSMIKYSHSVTEEGKSIIEEGVE